MYIMLNSNYQKITPVSNPIITSKIPKDVSLDLIPCHGHLLEPLFCIWMCHLVMNGTINLIFDYTDENQC